jgi:hypothetical protein
VAFVSPLLKSRLQLQQAKSSKRHAHRKVDHQQRIHLKPPTSTTQDVDEKFTAVDNVASPDSRAVDCTSAAEQIGRPNQSQYQTRSPSNPLLRRFFQCQGVLAPHVADRGPYRRGLRFGGARSTWRSSLRGAIRLTMNAFAIGPSRRESRRPAKFITAPSLARPDQVRAAYDPAGLFHSWMARG